MAKGSSGGGAGVGGSAAGAGGPGGQRPAGMSADGKHNVHLPKDKKRMQIFQADAALKQMGYRVEGRAFDLKTKTATTRLVHPDGSRSTVTVEQLRELVYRGQR